MSLVQVASILQELWLSVKGFLNSSFISAFLSALAGAGFGVWGAQRLAERAALRRELLDALRQANAVVVLAATISNQVLSLKKQHVSSLSKRFFADRELADKINEKVLSGLPGGSYVFHAELRKITPLSLPLEALKASVFSAHLMPGRALALVAMVELSALELAHAIDVRSSLIDKFHGAKLPPDVYCQDYYGLMRADGSVNAMYHDMMIAITAYTDDLAFFSGELATESQAHAERVRTRLLKLVRDPPKASSVDFSEAIGSGLMPPREGYESWLSGFKSAN